MPYLIAALAFEGFGSGDSSWHRSPGPGPIGQSGLGALSANSLGFSYRLIWHERAHRDPGLVRLRREILAATAQHPHRQVSNAAASRARPVTERVQRNAAGQAPDAQDGIASVHPSLNRAPTATACLFSYCQAARLPRRKSGPAGQNGRLVRTDGSNACGARQRG